MAETVADTLIALRFGALGYPGGIVLVEKARGN